MEASMGTPEEDAERARSYFNAEPLFTGPKPAVDLRIANALEFIAYQLWAINTTLRRMEGGM